MDWTWLIVLMCPFMMIPMLLMMMKGNHSGQGNHDHEKHLAEQLNELKKQNEAMQEKLRELETKDKF